MATRPFLDGDRPTHHQPPPRFFSKQVSSATLAGLLICFLVQISSPAGCQDPSGTSGGQESSEPQTSSPQPADAKRDVPTQASKGRIILHGKLVEGPYTLEVSGYDILINGAACTIPASLDYPEEATGDKPARGEQPTKETARDETMAAGKTQLIANVMDMINAAHSSLAFNESTFSRIADECRKSEVVRSARASEFELELEFVDGTTETFHVYPAQPGPQVDPTTGEKIAEPLPRDLDSKIAALRQSDVKFLEAMLERGALIVIKHSGDWVWCSDARREDYLDMIAKATKLADRDEARATLRALWLLDDRDVALIVENFRR